MDDKISSSTKIRRKASKEIRIKELEMKEIRTENEIFELLKLKYNSKQIEQFGYFTTYSFNNQLAPDINLSYTDIGKFYTLINKHLTHKSNILLETFNIKSSKLTIETIMKTLDLKKTMAYSLLSSLKKENLIKEISILKQTYLMVNPIYVLNGRITPILYHFFKAEINDCFKNIPKELKELWEIQFSNSEIF